MNLVIPYEHTLGMISVYRLTQQKDRTENIPCAVLIPSAYHTLPISSEHSYVGLSITTLSLTATLTLLNNHFIP